MSRLYTCESSWPNTARSSRSLRICRIARRAAHRGVARIAARGERVRRRGVADVQPRHRLARRRRQLPHDAYITGACISLTGWACIARSAILSLLKYT